ncbi:hypothetical protein HGRIS_011802 [Hohenbuehelia grisea]|uniref:Uncharacterized protein n=1 Tax=Hohenbuehelia grisea TaxID=104357 RepID=A0ABR3JW79_9AGAR
MRTMGSGTSVVNSSKYGALRDWRAREDPDIQVDALTRHRCASSRAGSPIVSRSLCPNVQHLSYSARRAITCTTSLETASRYESPSILSTHNTMFNRNALQVAQIHPSPDIFIDSFNASPYRSSC